MTKSYLKFGKNTIISNQKFQFKIKTIKGLNHTNTKKIFGALGLHKDLTINPKKSKFLIKFIKTILLNLIKKNKFAYLKQIEKIFIEKKQNTKQGWKYKYSLPVRNQRTKTNSKTVKKLRPKKSKINIKKKKMYKKKDLKYLILKQFIKNLKKYMILKLSNYILLHSKLQKSKRFCIIILERKKNCIITMIEKKSNEVFYSSTVKTQIKKWHKKLLKKWEKNSLWKYHRNKLIKKFIKEFVNKLNKKKGIFTIDFVKLINCPQFYQFIIKNEITKYQLVHFKDYVKKQNLSSTILKQRRQKRR